MPGSSTGTYTDADEFKASLADVFDQLTLTHLGAFMAHVDRTELRHIHLLQARESVSRVAYIAFPPDLVVLSFSADPKLPLIWRGVALGPDEVMIHAPGEHLHQRTDGPSRWGMIALSPSALSAFCKTETGRSLPVPEVSRIIKPPLRDWKCLLRVHRQAARLAETRPTIIGHPEVVRAMEYELAGLLVRCLTEGKTLPDPETTLRAIPVMRRFESMLAKPSHQLFSSAEFSAALNVSPRALQKYCLAFLGVGPRRYAQLRQLTHARTAICHADPRTARIAELARLAGFARPGHFAELYKAAYGETPIATLRRAGSA